MGWIVGFAIYKKWMLDENIIKLVLYNTRTREYSQQMYSTYLLDAIELLVNPRV